jgi:glycosyltransferase involved in cell wall biosynthesis
MATGIWRASRRARSQSGARASSVGATTRIVFVTRPFGRGGAEKHLDDLIERLEASWEVVILTMGPHPYSPRPGSQEERIRVVPGPRSGRFFASWRAFRKLKPQVIAFNNGDFPLFHWQMYVAARLSGARRVVAIEHSIANPPRDTNLAAALASQGKLSAILRWLTGPLRRAVTTRLPGLVCHATVCVSDAVRDRLIQEYRYPAAKTITRRNGVDVNTFAPAAGDWPLPGILQENSGAPVAICISTLWNTKRIDVLIEAMAAITPQFPESRCVILGSGPLEESLRKMATQLNLERNVLFAGQISDVRPYLAAGDIFVLPSEREGLPLSLLEAMAFGLPCVAAEAGGNREVIDDGVNGFVVPVGSVRAFADAMAKLFGDPAETARMGRNARRIVEARFDLDVAMARVKAEVLDIGKPA